MTPDATVTAGTPVMLLLVLAPVVALLVLALAVTAAWSVRALVNAATRTRDVPGLRDGAVYDRPDDYDTDVELTLGVLMQREPF
ncbi:hypothetical protein [Actinomadura macra]|uniref:hypothetical protein n=1 Tax=Actinomadura macra TaxID=46164 RepID=UPI00082B2710|nr:hypothetical protein [Actinomadura macra]